MKDTAIVLIVLILVIASFGGYFVWKSTQTSLSQTISASGSASIKVLPDEAAIYLQILTEDKSADLAKDKNAEILDKVTTALLKIELEKKDIQTDSFNIYPKYNYDEGKQEIIGYTVNHRLRIVTEDFDNVGKIIDAAVDNGALVESINFELSNEKQAEFKKQALEEASKDAREKADAIAAGLNARIGSLVSVTASSFDYYPYPIFRAETLEVGIAGAEAKMAVTDISPKELEVTAQVSVVYKVKG